jgi:hypothetical protein
MIIPIIKPETLPRPCLKNYIHSSILFFDKILYVKNSMNVRKMLHSKLLKFEKNRSKIKNEKFSVYLIKQRIVL